MVIVEFIGASARTSKQITFFYDKMHTVTIVVLTTRVKVRYDKIQDKIP